MAKELTDRTLKALKNNPPPSGKRQDVADGNLPGFGVRVTDTGVVTFVLNVRYPGSSGPARRVVGRYLPLDDEESVAAHAAYEAMPEQERPADFSTYLLEKFGPTTLAAARIEARRWKELVRRGKDPRTVQAEHAVKRDAEAKNNFGRVLADFKLHQLVGPDEAKPLQRKGAEVERDLRLNFGPSLDAKPIVDVTWPDIVAVIDAKVAAGARYQAHNLLGSIRRMFNWAIGRGVYGLVSSPCDRRRPADVIGKKQRRSRILNDDELRAFWVATDAMGYPYGPMYRLLLLTIQRLSQVSDATAGEFDLSAAGWLLSAERMKGEDDDPAPHFVPLSKPALALLEGLPPPTDAAKQLGDDRFLFSYSEGETPANSFSDAKSELDRLMLVELGQIAASKGRDPLMVKLAPWKNHDLRRTGRTHLSALPIQDNVRELVIAHTKPELHKVYDLWAFKEEKRQALDLWAERLLSIVHPANSNNAGNVVPFVAAVS